MSDETSNPNIEWKKNKGFGNKDRLTRKIDPQKALQQEALEKKSVAKTFSAKPTELPKNLKKIRKKIRDIYDDEEEDENDYLIAPLDLSNSLMEALHEDEKLQLMQKRTTNHQNMQQQAGKAAALLEADKVAKSFGLKGLDKKIVNDHMLNAVQSTYTFEFAIKEDVAKKSKIATKKLSEGETIDLLRGIKRIQALSAAADEKQLKAIEGWKLSEIVDAGKTSANDKEIAEKILEKSGRKKDKKTINKMVQKKSKTKDKASDVNVQRDFFRD